MHRRSRWFWVTEFAACLLLAAVGGANGWAQAAPVQPAAQTTTQQPRAAQQQAPQQQAPLTVDRDPVASPDPDPPVGAAAGTLQAPGVGVIERERGKYTLRADAYEVRLNATVLDGSGRSIQTLDKDAFRVYEDGVPQTIASFRHEDLPVSLGILIDSSGSMYDKRVAVEQASLGLVKLANPEGEAL